MFNTLSLIPILGMLVVFLLFLSYYWINLYSEFQLVEKEDSAISTFNAYYFSNNFYGTLKKSNFNSEFKINFCDSSGSVVFPVYSNGICMVSIHARNL